MIDDKIGKANHYFWLTTFLQDAATWLDYRSMPEKTVIDKTRDALILSMQWRIGSVRIALTDKGKGIVKTFKVEDNGLAPEYYMRVSVTMMAIADAATRLLKSQIGEENVIRNDE